MDRLSISTLIDEVPEYERRAILAKVEEHVRAVIAAAGLQRLGEPVVNIYPVTIHLEVEGSPLCMFLKDGGVKNTDRANYVASPDKKRVTCATCHHRLRSWDLDSLTTEGA